ncbi:TIGR03089 family protein [Kibdelosporangium philippinense]|uniref:TIGR03089 family protein n=1 Tax=Kibdelosporangium philippinense TaxID=211113 RepID=A0ABS8ZF16_9PSEU|nr:TIGR03089 family protein [Kibdelosporangium philippinense]MCE7006037.1 TIGR03089 family protein [Kibdelosporangium philippinense]
MSVTEALFRPLLAGDRSRPLITHYDDAAGTRVELSIATLANWAAKTANWLTEEFDVEPGTPITVDLPAHWQTAGVLLGAWWCGAHVVSSGGAVALTTVDAPKPDGSWAVVSLDPMGMGLRGSPPDGAVDYISESRMFGDDFFPLQDVPDSTPALGPLTVAEVVSAARAMAITGRILSTMEWTFPDGVLTSLLSVLAGKGSLVQVSNPSKVDAHMESERATLLTAP